MGVIKGKDLVDFDDCSRQFDRLEARNEKFANDFVTSASKYTQAWKEAVREISADLKTLEAAYKSLNLKPGGGGAGRTLSIKKEIDENISSLERYKSALNSVSDLTDLNNRTIAELKAGISALKNQYDNLDPASENFQLDQIKITNNVKAATAALNMQNQAMKLALRSVGEAGKSYNKLNRETTELKNQLRAMPNAFDVTTGAINRHNVAAVAMQRQIEINDKALKRMDVSMGNHQRNVGNYSSAVSSLGTNLTGAITHVLGIATAFEALAASVRVIDQMSRLKLSLEAVSSSSAQVAKRWEFLAELADRTGQDISALAENYVSFAGATRNTSLEGAKGDAIFKSFSNTFAALGKSSDVANRGLYALQQMISKGKVSSEELNQQLAEALPGANKLFADALNVSTMELADMMKHGEVLATDVLPKVAKRLEQIYGDRAQKNTETISGSWTRLITQFKLFLDTMNQENVVAKFFAKINNGLADSVRGMSSLITNTKEVVDRFKLINDNAPKGMFDGFFGLGQAKAANSAAKQVSAENINVKNQVSKVQSISDNKKRIDVIMQEEEQLKKATKALAAWDEETKDVIYRSDDMKTKTLALNLAIDRQRKLVEALKEAESKRGSTPKEKEIKDPVLKPDDGDDKDKKRQLTAWEKLIDSAEKYRGVLVDNLLADAKAGRALEVSDEALAKWNKLYQLINQVATATGDQIPSNLRELNDKLNKTPTDIAKDIQIETLSEPKAAKDPEGPQDISKFVGVIQAQEKEMNDMLQRLTTGSLRKFSDEYAKALTDQLTKIQDLERQAALEINADKKAALQEQISAEKAAFDEKMRLAREEVAAKKQLQAELTELALVSVDAIFKINSDQRSADMEANKMQMEHELSLVQGNEAAQNRIKKEYGKKDLELRQKQAKADKAQAAFSIGISTARAVVNALATGGPPWIGIALAAIVGAMGAIQLAAVLAKPLPQFYKGTDNAPEGLAHIAERGPEIRESNGRMMLYPKRTVAYLNKGDKVYTADETRAILSRGETASQIGEILGRGQSHNQVRLDAVAAAKAAARMASKDIDYNRLADAVASAVSKLPITEFTYDESGIRKRTRTQNSTMEYLNDRYSTS